MVVSVLTFTLPPLVAACQSVGLVGLGFMVTTVLVVERTRAMTADGRGMPDLPQLVSPTTTAPQGEHTPDVLTAG